MLCPFYQLCPLLYHGGRGLFHSCTLSLLFAPVHHMACATHLLQLLLSSCYVFLLFCFLHYRLHKRVWCRGHCERQSRPDCIRKVCLSDLREMLFSYIGWRLTTYQHVRFLLEYCFVNASNFCSYPMEVFKASAILPCFAIHALNQAIWAFRPWGLLVQNKCQVFAPNNLDLLFSIGLQTVDRKPWFAGALQAQCTSQQIRPGEQHWVSVCNLWIRGGSAEEGPAGLLGADASTNFCAAMLVPIFVLQKQSTGREYICCSANCYWIGHKASQSSATCQ